jgi:hypothetical protein
VRAGHHSCRVDQIAQRSVDIKSKICSGEIRVDGVSGPCKSLRKHDRENRLFYWGLNSNAIEHHWIFPLVAPQKSSVSETTSKKIPTAESDPLFVEAGRKKL